MLQGYQTRQYYRLFLTSQQQLGLGYLIVLSYHVIISLTTQQPQYLSELIRYYETPRKLRSRGVNILQTNATALDFSKRAFCHTSPTVWNSLPQSVISDLTVTTGTFKHRLKSAMYTRAFLQ